MLKKKVTRDYVNELAKKYDLPKELVNNLLVYGMKNICKLIEKGEDIRTPAMNITSNKTAFSKYIKKIRERQEKSNKQLPGDDLG